MAKLETVKVVFNNKQGYVVINKSDFERHTHKLYVKEPPKVEKPVRKVKEIKKNE